MKRIEYQANRIVLYHQELKDLSVVNYDEQNFHLPVFPNLFCDCDNCGLQQHLFTTTVYHPLFNILSHIQNEPPLTINWNTLGNEYMMTDEEVITFMQLINPNNSRLILDNVNVPTSVYTNLNKAILTNDLESLKKAAALHDLSPLYKKLGFLRDLTTILVDKSPNVDAISYTSNELVIYAFRHIDMSEIMKGYNYSYYSRPEVNYEEAKLIVKNMIEHLYFDIYNQYSSFEKEKIGIIAKGNIAFKKYYESITKINKSDFVSILPDALPKPDSNPNLICGVEGLAKALNCGKNTAQKILNKRILQKEKIAYRAGKGWRINKSKLFEFLSQNPNALKD